MSLNFICHRDDIVGPSDRRCPTASIKRRRRGEYSIIPVIEEAPQREEDEEEELNGHFMVVPLTFYYCVALKLML